MPRRRSSVLCFDEAGGIGPFPIIAFGLLLVNEPDAVLEAVKRVRRRYGFVNELKSSRWSNLRRRVYVDVLTEAVKHDVLATVLVAQKRDLDRRYFPGKDYMAYNYLAKRLVVRATVEVQGATLYVDKKQRTRRDNFLEYLKAEVNLGALEDGRLRSSERRRKSGGGFLKKRRHAGHPASDLGRT
ncbi:MAG TPA: hypothetical protein EYP49_15735 [Anaerolineae bacterium]|nr:hypothetical protein [Anaerolineae bacterium]